MNPNTSTQVILDETEGFAVTLWQSDGGAVLLRLRSEEDTEHDYCPTATVFPGATTGTAARLVYASATTRERTDEELAACRAFLRQWAEGPQLPTELNARVERALIREGFYGTAMRGGHDA